MSEEQNELQVEKNCKFTTVLVISILSLLFSVTALTFSLTGVSSSEGGGQDRNAVVISRQYDKGRSLDKALEAKKPMLVFFYTDWCGFCQRFAPTFDKITKDGNIKKNFAIAYVNCEDQNNQKHTSDYGIEGFPTVYVVDKDGKRTRLENETFFTETAKEDVVNKALELIGIIDK